MTVPFRIDVATTEHRHRLVVHGEFDIARIATFERLAGAVAGRGDAVMVDLRRSTIVDSSAIGALIRLRRRITGDDSHMEVVAAPGWQDQLLRQAGVSELLAVRIEARDSELEPPT